MGAVLDVGATAAGGGAAAASRKTGGGIGGGTSPIGFGDFSLSLNFGGSGGGTLAGIDSPMSDVWGGGVLTGSVCAVGCATLSRGLREKDGLAGAADSTAAGGLTGNSAGSMSRFSQL